MASRLVGTSSATRTLDQRDLAALRPARENAPRPRKPRREPMARSRTFFCSNKNCDHATWSPQEQAIHMAREFSWAMQALVMRAPDSPEALKLTGGVLLAELTDDECRAYNSQSTQAYMRGEIPSAEAVLGKQEYRRRRHAGILTPSSRQVVADSAASFTDEEVLEANSKCRGLRRAGLPIPDDVRAKANEYRRRRYDGRMSALPPEERSLRHGAAARRAHTTRYGAAGEREVLVPPVGMRVRLRESVGLSLRELASILGVSKGAVQHWERSSDPTLPGSVEMCIRYAEALEWKPKAGLEQDRRAS